LELNTICFVERIGDCQDLYQQETQTFDQDMAGSFEWMCGSLAFLVVRLLLDTCNRGRSILSRFFQKSLDANGIRLLNRSNLHVPHALAFALEEMFRIRKMGSEEETEGNVLL
jgi:hypothetical protein